MNAIVTGATRGIGRAIVIMLAQKGFNIAYAARNTREITLLKEELEKINPEGQFIGIAADLSDKENVFYFSNEVKSKWARIELLVNNAGIYQPGFMLEEADENLHQQMNLNFYSAYYLTKAIAPLMVRQQKGHVFFICSALSIEPRAGAGAYAVSKAALKALADNWREELRIKHVKVTSILPYATYTSSWEGTSIEQNKFIQAEDVASAVLAAYNTSESAVVEEVFINNIQPI